MNNEYTFAERINKQLCWAFGHKFDEFHMYEVVCSRCRTCRPYTEEDEANLEKKKTHEPTRRS